MRHYFYHTFYWTQAPYHTTESVCGYGQEHRLSILWRDAAARPRSVQTLHHSTSSQHQHQQPYLETWLRWFTHYITLHLTKAETGRNNIWHLMDAFRKLGEPSLVLLWWLACLCLVTSAVQWCQWSPVTTDQCDSHSGRCPLCSFLIAIISIFFVRLTQL